MLPVAALEAERDRAFAAVGAALGLAAWPLVTVTWNRRLRLAGRAVIEGRRAGLFAARIELSPPYFEVYPDDLHGILVHESVHVGLAWLGRPFGHGAEFRAACRASGGLAHSRPMPGRMFRYLCPVCRTIVERRRRPSGDRWCAACATDERRGGRSPFTAERALRLVGLGFTGPDPRFEAERAARELRRSVEVGTLGRTASEGAARETDATARTDAAGAGAGDRLGRH